MNVISNTTARGLAAPREGTQAVSETPSRIQGASSSSKDACILPHLNAHSVDTGEIHTINTDSKIMLELQSLSKAQQISFGSLCKATWAILLHAYLQADQPCFGIISDDIEHIAFASIDDNTSILDLLKQSQVASREVQRPENQEALFNTAISVSSQSLASSDLDRLEKHFNSMDLVVSFSKADENLLSLSVSWRSHVLDTAQATNLLFTTEKALQSIVRSPGAMVKSLDLLSSRDENQLFRWNGFRPNPEMHRLHDQVLRHAAVKPAAIAIEAHDGALTYQDLEIKTRQLALQLVALGVRPEMPVPICFERSKWSVVASIAIIRAGGAWVPLEPSHPTERWRAIIETCDAHVAVASKALAGQLSPLIGNVLVASEESLEDDSRTLDGLELAAAPSPESAACILFTSGSTGTPKGVVHRHRDILTNIKYQNPYVQVNRDTRAAAHVPYSFIVSAVEMWTCLVEGGCICIPSDWEKMNDLAGFINRSKVTWVAATPSLFATLKLEDIPSVRTVFLAGEKQTEAVAERSGGRLSVLNCYGSTEGIAHTILKVQPGQDPHYIGPTRGCVAWVVDQFDHDRLLPIGAIGELLLEGYNIAKEYINNPAQTQATFIKDPKWYRQFREGEQSIPLLKTGDLVRYNSDGTLNIVGRKDFQVKLRGQRIEPGEIEFHLGKVLPNIGSFAVELVRPSDLPKPILLAFVDSELDPVAKENAISRIAALVPSYMVPSGIASIKPMPLTISNKINRKELRAYSAGSTLSKLLGRSTDQDEVASRPLNEAETQLSVIWRKVLDIDADTEIGVHANFTLMGGDSLAAMDLVSHARDAGFSIEVSNVLRNPTLSGMASFLAVTKVVLIDDYTPFSLVPAAGEATAEVSDQLKIPIGEIEDLYPATAYQEGTLAALQKRPGAFMTRFPIPLPQSVEIQRLKNAWASLVAGNPILRTRFVQTSAHGLLQVVLRPSSPYWRSFTSRDEALATSCSIYQVSDQLSEVGLTAAAPNGGIYMIWTIHHSLFDGWSMRSMIRKLDAAYLGQEAAGGVPFTTFMQHLNKIDTDSQRTFWIESLKDARPEQYPALPSVHYAPVSDSILTRTLRLAKQQSEFTISTRIQAAWAVTVAQYTSSSDIVYGLLQTGRSASVTGIQDIDAPTITTIPFRIRFDGQKDAEQLLSYVRDNSAASIPFEQAGLQHIETLSSDAKAACNFQNVLLIQPDTNNLDGTLAPESLSGALHEFNTYALLLECQLLKDGNINVTMLFDSKVLSEPQAQHVLAHFDSVLNKISTYSPDTSLAELRKLSTTDEEHIRRWNRELPPHVDVCVHELVRKGASLSPESLAVESHDGKLSHGKLESLSNSLATHLSSLGVGPGMVVPFCMEKSVFAVVAMLAILKAGGTMCPLSVEYPLARHQEILLDVSAKIILVSSGQAPTFSGLVSQTIVVCKDMIDSLPSTNEVPSSIVTPEDVAAIVFTSGSTGQPKGIIQPHRAISTNLTYMGPAQNITRESRVFQFSAFTFDVSFGDIFGTLMRGGCVVLPSEDQRRTDVGGAIISLRATQATLVPTVANSLEPAGLNTLQATFLGGERIEESLFEKWKNHVQVHNVWGTTELSVWSSCNIVKSGSPYTDISSATGCRMWLVNPEDVNELVPIGAVGEIVVEGHTVTRGYWQQPDKTNAAYIEGPDWLNEDRSLTDRLFRTGDLARRDPNGALVFLGRKDYQVKINGQRTELTEIEANLKRAMPGVSDLIVDLITPVDQSDLPQLCTFVRWAAAGAADEDTGISSVDRERFQDLVHAATSTVSRVLPAYMVPTVFLPMGKWPMTVSGKTDRRRMKSLVSNLTLESLYSFKAAKEALVEPKTEMEIKLRDLWSQIIKIPTSKIGANSDLFELGGNSLSVMRLASLARKHHVHLVANQIFANSRLDGMAAVAEKVAPDPTSVEQIEPFSLLEEGILRQSLLDQVQHEDPSHGVEDIYPCTPWQEIMIWVAVNHPRADLFVAREISALGPEVDLQEFKAAWEQVWAQEAILRTQFLQSDSGAYQVVMKKPLEWNLRTSLDECIAEDQARSLHPDRFELLNRFYCVDDGSGSQRYLVWSSHHSVFDGWTIRNILTRVATAYAKGEVAPSPPYTKYVKYITSADKTAAKEHFAKLLEGAVQTPFPGPHPDEYIFLPEKVMKYDINLGFDTSTKPQLSSRIKAAWGILVSRTLNQSDVVFAHTTIGRNVSLVDAVDVAGPMIGTVPVRVQLKSGQLISTLINEIGEQASSSFEHEHIGIQGVQAASEDAARACEFKSLLVVQPYVSLQDNDAPELGFSGMTEWIQNFNVLGVTFDCTLGPSGVRVMVSFDEKLTNVEEMKIIVLRFESLLRQLLAEEKNPESRTDELIVLDGAELKHAQSEATIVVENRMVKYKEEPAGAAA